MTIDYDGLDALDTFQKKLMAFADLDNTAAQSYLVIVALRQHIAALRRENESELIANAKASLREGKE